MREIQIRRKETISYLPPRVVADSRKKLGSIFVSRSPLRGLTPDEEKKYLPRVIGIGADDRDFTKQARIFWAEFSIDVPSDGLVLNITVNGEGEPDNVDDWMKWRWASIHRFVAPNKEAMKKDPLQTFYIYDPEVETRKTNNAIQNKKAAYKEFSRISATPNEMRSVLRVLGTHNPETLTNDQQENLLSTLLEANPENFLKVTLDKNLPVREFIFRLIETNVIRKIGESYLYNDTTIGDTENEAISYIKNTRNSAHVSDMKAKLKEFGIGDESSTKEVKSKLETEVK